MSIREVAELCASVVLVVGTAVVVVVLVTIAYGVVVSAVRAGKGDGE